MILSTLKKAKKYSTLAEVAVAGALMSLNTHGRELFKTFSIYLLPLIPAIDIAKLIIYWKESNSDAYKKGTRSKWMNRSFYMIKAASSTAATVLAGVGLLSLGLLLLVGVSYIRSIRAGYRTYRNLRKGEYQKAKGHFQKLVVSLMFSLAPTFLLFVPPIAILGWASFVTAGLYVMYKSGTALKRSHQFEKSITPEADKIEEAERHSAPARMTQTHTEHSVIHGLQYEGDAPIFLDGEKHELLARRHSI